MSCIVVCQRAYFLPLNTAACSSRPGLYGTEGSSDTGTGILPDARLVFFDPGTSTRTW